MTDKKLFWLLMTESPETPVQRRHVRAHNIQDAATLVHNSYPRARILRMGEITDVEEMASEHMWTYQIGNP